MLNWSKILEFAEKGNPEPDRRVTKTEEEWSAQLSEEEFRVTRLKGTERPFSSEMCGLFEPGRYACVCCGTLLFDASEKFESGTGWPSFTQPVKENAVAYHGDSSHGMTRIETTCNTCDAHLGHVFPDGPAPSGLRYCINAVSMKKVQEPDESEKTLALATFGGGCFWCTEAFFQELRGVKSVTSGYAGGATENPSYRQVCTGETGHAEVVQIEYDPSEISYGDLARLHFASHDPTTLNRQGADVGTQYRSVLFYRNDAEREQAIAVRDEVASELGAPVVTELAEFEMFYPAEADHQNYYRTNPQAGYCMAVISPKLAKLRAQFSDRLQGEPTL